jgi:hypothetical protein
MLGFIVPTVGPAAWASRFSLSLREEYNDNIFFTTDKEHDFITVITPLSLTAHFDLWPRIALAKV